MTRIAVASVPPPDAALRLEDALGPLGKRRAPKLPPVRERVPRALAEVERRLAADDWQDVTPGLLLAVHCWCHRRVYGADPIFTSGDWKLALLRAGSLVKRQFDGDATAALAYVRWSWQREGRRENYRRGTNGEVNGSSLGWALVLGGRLLTDYRVHLARTRGRS
jgi:hypothetical protein